MGRKLLTLRNSLSFLLGISLIWPWPARSAEEGRATIAFFDVAKSSPFRDDQIQPIRAAIQAGLERSARFSPLPRSSIVQIQNRIMETTSREQQMVAAARTALEKFGQLMAEGKEWYLNSDFQQATERLGQALETLREGLVLLEDSRPWIDALIYSAVSYQFLGDEEQAQNYFKLAIHIDPSYRIDPSQFPPDVVRVFRQRQAAVRKKSVRRTLELEIAPPGATVILNGRRIGTSPEGSKRSIMQIGELLPGPYALVVRKEGHFTEIRDVTLDAETKQLKVKLNSVSANPTDPVTLLQPFPNQEKIDARRFSALEAFAIEHALDIVLLISIGLRAEGLEVTGQLYDRRNGVLTPAVTRTGTLRIHEPPILGVIRDLERYVDADGYCTVVRGSLTPSPLEQAVREERAKRPFYKTWWFWTAVGAAAVGGGAATYFLAFRDNDGTTFRISAPSE